MKDVNLLRRFLFVVFFALFQLPVFSQSDELIDNLLNERYAEFGKAAYLVLAGANLISSDASVTKAGKEAIAFLKNSGWHIRIQNPDSAMSLGEYAYIIMRAFKIKGGIMYTIFPCPRYASRELYYLGFITGSKDPFRKISGEEAVSILQSVLEWKGANR